MDITGVTNDMFVGQRHRSASIHKTENGYTITAKFRVETTNYTGKTHKEMSSLVYVYYTVEEVLDFLKQYMNAPAEELEK